MKYSTLLSTLLFFPLACNVLTAEDEVDKKKYRLISYVICSLSGIDIENNLE